MALGSIQPLTEMSTRCISWGKGGLCVRLTTLPPSCVVVMKSGNLNFLEPSGPLEVRNGTALPLPFINLSISIYMTCCCQNYFSAFFLSSDQLSHSTMPNFSNALIPPFFLKVVVKTISFPFCVISETCPRLNTI